MLFVGTLVHLSTFAFGKCFERSFCIIFGCIWGTTERPYWLVCPLASDNRALIGLALMHDVIVFAELWVLLL
jgi:hypothetical protein